MGLLATSFRIDGLEPLYRGESKDLYRYNDQLIVIATDRLTVFGHVFPDAVEGIGVIATELTAYFAERTRQTIPNWLESSPDPNVAVGKYCKPFRLNMVIRGALLGHAWRVYEAGIRTLCGVPLPNDLQEYDVFNEPIITPTIKTPSGFEEDITPAELVAQGYATESEYERLHTLTRQLFIEGKITARRKGLYLADAKYEFGIYNGEITAIDEVHTPDTCRFYDAEDYKRYLRDRLDAPPKDLSKEYIRQWLLSQGYSGTEGQVAPVIPQTIRSELQKRYSTLYKRLLDKSIPATHFDEITRIETILKTLCNKKAS